MALWKQKPFFDEFNLPHQSKLKRGLAAIRYWCNFRAHSNQYTLGAQARAKRSAYEKWRVCVSVCIAICILSLRFVSVFRWFAPFIVASILKTAHRAFNAIHVNSPIVRQFYGFAWCICALSHSFLRSFVCLFSSVFVLLQWHLSLCKLQCHFMHPFDTYCTSSTTENRSRENRQWMNKSWKIEINANDSSTNRTHTSSVW